MNKPESQTDSYPNNTPWEEVFKSDNLADGVELNESAFLTLLDRVDSLSQVEVHALIAFVLSESITTARLALAILGGLAIEQHSPALGAAFAVIELRSALESHQQSTAFLTGAETMQLSSDAGLLTDSLRKVYKKTGGEFLDHTVSKVDKLLKKLKGVFLPSSAKKSQPPR